MTAKPKSVDIITYNVGFGDCFLLRIHYRRARSRHVLIDFGSTKQGDYSLTEIANEIRRDCGDEKKLDVVVATHRHKDHIAGFARTKTGAGTGKIIRDLAPAVVIQPWTEDPNAQPDAMAPTQGDTVPDARRSLTARLASMQGLAGEVYEYAKILRFAHEADLHRELRALGENNLANAAAVQNLRSMAPRTYYAYHGMPLDLAADLPGVDVLVLGPPTLEQTDTITKQRSRDRDEFWHVHAAALGAATGHTAFDGLELPPHDDPQWGRWLRRRLRKANAEQAYSIVRSLDHQMNNTSLILLFKIGKRRLLFPGDAQYENWMYALEQDWVRAELEDVDVYKVGHHGSLNASPKTMFDLFRKRASCAPTEVMHSLLSTKSGVHGAEERRTEVPRKTLVHALEEETRLTATPAFSGIKQIISLTT